MEGKRELKRTHHCGLLRAEDVGQKVTLMGWVQRRRDHGGLIFIDLRDRSGIVQVVLSPEVDEEAFHRGEEVRSEYVLAVRGTVSVRPEGTENPNLATGQVEVYAEELQILNRAKTPPFYIEEGIKVDENVRLKYRYLDLRRPDMQRNLIIRHQAAKVVRDFLSAEGFIEVETPMLTRSTPEGARDFLVPSRLSPGDFYALPQSPQLFKQLLMVAGLERYFQIVRCFRDEDLRADRQPEFTQIDIEMSFVDRETILALMEKMMARIFAEVLDIQLTLPFPRLTYQEAMDRYGSDKPDTRFGMEIVDVTAAVAESGFKVFRQAVEKGGQVKGLNLVGGLSLSRKEIDVLTEYVAQFGAKGLAWIRVSEEGLNSPIVKFLQEEEQEALCRLLEARVGDLLLFVAGPAPMVADSLGHLRLHLARKQGLIPEDKYNFVWIVDFPLLE
ncbi:MAG: aspartate--tRNA ligase, partial [bacterium]